MFELLAMSLLGVEYIGSTINESNEEKQIKEKERIRDLKIKVFCYAVRHNMLYDVVVKKLQDKELSFDDIEKDKGDK